MAELRKEAYGPEGDPARHRPLAELEAGLRALPTAPRDSGHLALIVRRRADGVRETPQRVRLLPDEGVPGDGWSRRPPRDPEAQLAVMRRDVGELVGNGQPLTVFGDNLFVDLDLSCANLPPGSRLRVGRALVEVTPKPHNGCRKFEGRFGRDALRFVQAPATRDQNLRGIYWRVVESGEACLGDRVEVLSRAGVVAASRPKGNDVLPETGFALVHGGGLDTWVWRRLLPHLSRPAIAVRRMPPAADPRRLSTADCARTVASQIEEAGLARAILVAHSIGGVIASELARVAPERLAHVVFLSANVPGEGENVLSAFPLGQRLQMRLGQRLAAWGLTPRKALASWVLETLCHDLDPEATAQMLEGAMHPEPSRLFFDRVSPRALGSVPCTYVELLQDRALPPEVQERMAKRVGARVVFIDCGHTVMLARPVELASVLNEVADRLDSARQATA